MICDHFGGNGTGDCTLSTMRGKVAVRWESYLELKL